MAWSTENIIFNNGDWLVVELDPNTEDCLRLIISQVGSNFGVEWSVVNTITDTTALLPEVGATFNYDVYIRNKKASESNPITIAVTRLCS